MQNNQSPFQKLSLLFEVASPIHIGTKEGRILANEFLVHDGFTYVLDEDRFGQFLLDREAIDLFLEQVRQGNRNTEGFLKNRLKISLSNEILKKIALYKIPGGQTGMNDFRPFTRDANGKIYLPGSSLKGVFRTALLFKILEQDKELIHKIEERTEQNASELRKKAKSFSEKWLQAGLLQQFDLPGSRSGPNKDILRCVKVRDAYPVGDVESKIIKLQYLCKDKSGEFRWSSNVKGVWVEAVVKGKFRVNLVWDESLFEQFKKQNLTKLGTLFPLSCLDDLIGLAGHMSKKLRDREINFFQNPQKKLQRQTSQGSQDEPPAIIASRLSTWYDNLSGKYTRIGFGSGMLGTTMAMHFSDTLVQKIRNSCGHPRGNDPAPKSRRIWKHQGEWMPLGWLKIPSTDDPPSLSAPLQKPSDESGKLDETPSPSWAAVAREAVRAVIDEQPGISELQAAVRFAPLQDKLQVERLVSQLEEMEDIEIVSQSALVLKNRLLESGKWNKHPLAQRITMLL